MDTRLRILETTADLLQKSSGEPPSTRAVCQAAGITPPTLYHHFGDKDGLYDAVAAYGFETYLTTDDGFGATGDPVADLRRGWDAHVEFAVTHPALYALMFGVTRSSPARTVLTTLLTRVAEAGRLRIDLERAAPAVEAACVGAALQVVRGGSDATSGQLRDLLLASLVEEGTANTAAPERDPVAGTARQLAAQLSDGSHHLTPEESALLRQWLHRLTVS